MKSTEERIQEIFGEFDLTKDELIKMLFEFNETLKLENHDLYKENEQLRESLIQLNQSKIVTLRH